MPFYDIAGLKVRMNDCGGRSQAQAQAYLAENQDENQKFDIDINVDRQRVLDAMAELSLIHI